MIHQRERGIMSRKKDLSKQKEVDFVNGFKKITVKNICKDLYISDANVSTGNASKENFEKIRIEIEDRFVRLYLKYIEGLKNGN